MFSEGGFGHFDGSIFCQTPVRRWAIACPDFSGPSCHNVSSTCTAVANQAALFGDEKWLIAIEASLSEHAIIAYLAALAGRHAIALLPPGDTRAAASFEKKYRPDICFRKIGDRWRTDHVKHPSIDNLHPDLTLLLTTSGSTGQCKSTVFARMRSSLWRSEILARTSSRWVIVNLRTSVHDPWPGSAKVRSALMSSIPKPSSLARRINDSRRACSEP
jgi:hypothetical protein